MRPLLPLGLALSLLACATDRPADPRGGGEPPPPPIELAWSSLPAWTLATDATSLYVGGEVVARISLDGAVTETLYTPPPVTGDLVFTRIDQLVVGQDVILFVHSEDDYSRNTTRRTLYRLAKAGGEPTALATSADPRAFIGVTIDGDRVLFSTFTAILEVPLAGGIAPRFVAESPGPVQHWIFSPTVIGDQLLWAEHDALYGIPRGGRGRGAQLGALPGVGEIVRVEPDALVVALSSSIAFQDGIDAFVEVSPGTGEVRGPEIMFGRQAQQMIATETDVWTTSFDGVHRIPRTGGPAEQLPGLMPSASFALAASEDALFVSVADGIARVAR